MDLALLLGVISFITSAIAGVFGLGGGLMLIAIIPNFLPAQAIIPVHAVTQVSSNASRAWFAYKDIQLNLLPPFLAGSALGVAIFGWLLFSMPTELIPVCIGSYILLTLWCPPFEALIHKYETLFTAGLFQTGLGLIVGTTGPLATAILTKKLSDKEAIVATNATFMLISHVAKIIVFGMVGFAYQEFLLVILLMVAGAILGSWVGTKYRRTMDNSAFNKILKWLLTVLALNMLISSIFL